MASEQEQDQQQAPQSTSAAFQQGRRRRAAPPDDLMRNSIASNLTQIMVNMRNAKWQQKCREILQVEDLTHGAHVKIVAALERIDAKREQREQAVAERQKHGNQ